jgi:hypothetical protein
MASAQTRSGVRGRPPPKRWVFTCRGMQISMTSHTASGRRQSSGIGVGSMIRPPATFSYSYRSYSRPGVIRIGSKASGSSRRGLTCAALPVVVSWTADRGSMPPRCCPATAPRRGAPFPPPGPRGTSSPASQVLWGAPIPGRPCRPPSLPSRDGYHPVRLCSSLHASPTPAWGQECSGQATPRTCRYRGGDGRASQVPGEPPFPFALFNRRRQDCGHQTGTVPQRGPWYVKSRGSHERSFDAP